MELGGDRDKASPPDPYPDTTKSKIGRGGGVGTPTKTREGESRGWLEKDKQMDTVNAYQLVCRPCNTDLFTSGKNEVWKRNHAYPDKCR